MSTPASSHQWDTVLPLQDPGAFRSAIAAHWHSTTVTVAADERCTMMSFVADN